MKRINKGLLNDKGVSLVEVLAVLVITSIVMTLATSFVVSSNKQNHAQQNEVRQIFDSAYILKIITKDIRRADEIVITHSPTDSKTTYELLLNESNVSTYTFINDDQLLRNGSTLSHNMSSFSLTSTNSIIAIEFVINGEKSSTNIALRKGGAL